MKIPLLYGVLLAVVASLMTYGLFFAGFHDSADKFKTAQAIAFWGGIVIGVVGLSLAMRERRTQTPANQTWGYGPALGTGVMTGLWAALFGAISFYIYVTVVNAQFCDVAFQTWVADMERKGLTAQVDAASGFMHKIYSPVGLLVSGFVGGFIFYVLEALIVAIFFRKPVPAAEPLEASQPPPVS